MNNNLLGNPRHNFIANSQFIYQHCPPSGITQQFGYPHSNNNFCPNNDRFQRRASDNFKQVGYLQKYQNHIPINTVSQSMIFSRSPDLNIKETDGNFRGMKPISLQNMGRFIQAD